MSTTAEILSTGVGSLWLVEGLPKITNRFDGDIPIIELNEPIKVVVPSQGYLPRPMAPSTNTRMHAFILYKMNVQLWGLHVFKSICQGPLCKALDSIHMTSCGCFTKKESSPRLCLCLELNLRDPEKKKKDISIVNFSSKDFTAFCFKNGYIPQGLDSTEFSKNRNIKRDLTKKVEKIIKKVNRNGGWTVCGWLKHGKTRDEAQVQDDNVKSATNMDAAEATHHLTELKPTNNVQIQGLDALRFDAKTLLTSQPAIPASALAGSDDDDDESSTEDNIAD